MIDFVGKRNWFFVLSGIIIAAALFFLIVFGLKPGVDFSSGTAMTLRFEKPVELAQVRDEMTRLGYDRAVVQRTGTGDFFVRMETISTEEREKIVSSISGALNSKLTVLDYFTVSPILATETVRNTGVAVLVAVAGILLYVVWAFRKMPKPFKWGTCAVAGLSHDVVVMLGIFSFLGWVAGVEVDSLFISAVLAILGYSINNIIIVFDRIRENINRGISKDFAVTVNASILETVARSANTSLTTLFAVVAVFLIGGATVHNFMLALLIGVVVGTYTSLCISGQLLVAWERPK